MTAQNVRKVVCIGCNERIGYFSDGLCRLCKRRLAFIFNKPLNNNKPHVVNNDQ